MISSIEPFNGRIWGGKGGERGRGTPEAGHGGELRRGIIFTAEPAAVRRGDCGLSTEEVSPMIDGISP